MPDEFTEWLESTEKMRQSLLDYSRSPIPTDPGERHLDVSKALSLGQDAGDLLADIDRFLSVEVAKATLEARKDHDAQTARVIAKGYTASIARLRDGLAVAYQTIRDRRFSLMSVGRW